MAPVKPTHDYYTTLEVCSTANHNEIKAAYRRLALRYHPDRNCGTQEATKKFQLISAAWETLGDTGKRQEYDRNRPKINLPTPKSSSHSRPTSTAQDDTSTEADDRKKRQAWLEFERSQEQKIRDYNQKVKPLVAEIKVLEAKIAENKAKLASDVPYWWNTFASWSKRMPEDEKSELDREILGSEAAIRIKKIFLEGAQSRLRSLQEELTRRRVEEAERLASKLREKMTKERLAREAEARRRAEGHAKQRAAEEARARAERAEAEKIRQKKVAEEQATREAARKKREEELLATILEKAKRERERRAQQPKPQETYTAHTASKGKKTQNTTNNQHNKTNRQTRTTEDTCTHRAWWDRVDGYHDCAHCTRPLYTFAYQCTGCDTIGCASCMHTLKRGKPTVNNGGHQQDGREHDRHGKRNGKNPRFSTAAATDDSDYYWYYDD